MMRRGALLALLLGLGTAAPAIAGPFAEVGDRQLRQDVDLLAASGLIEGPTDSWPLPWAQIDAGLNRAHDGRALDPYLKLAVERLDRLADLAAQRVAVDIRLGATNHVSVARDFGSLARGKFDGSTRLEFNSGDFSIALGTGVRYSDNGPNAKTYLHFEPTQVAVKLGNWALYGGYTEQWYGPGHDGALLWSNSARPTPKIGLKRLVPDKIDFPVLRWLGPTQIEIFGTLLDGPRSDYSNILAFGTRVSFTPVRGLQIGLNRAQMLCGDGRPCGLKQVFNSFLGVGNADNPTAGDVTAFLNQAGNQIAGWDISYTQRFGKVTAKFYVEAEAEDFDNIILEQYSRQIGTTLQGPWGKGGASWVATLEYADTQAVSLFNGTFLEGATGGETTYPASMYNNTLFFDGYTYRGRPIGYWTDGDSRNLSFSAAVTDTHNRRWYGSVRSVHINFNNIGNPPVPFNDPAGDLRALVSYRISANSEKFAIVTAGAELPLSFGDVRIEGRVQSDSPNTPGYQDRQAAIEVQFRQRF